MECDAPEDTGGVGRGASHASRFVAIHCIDRADEFLVAAFDRGEGQSDEGLKDARRKPHRTPQAHLGMTLNVRVLKFFLFFVNNRGRENDG
jgi:hypothetical protein